MGNIKDELIGKDRFIKRYIRAINEASENEVGQILNKLYDDGFEDGVQDERERSRIED